jgi:hypothetical protein
MRYQVVMQVKAFGRNTQGVEYVEAPNKSEAKYRGSYAAESKGHHVYSVTAVRPA